MLTRASNPCLLGIANAALLLVVISGCSATAPSDPDWNASGVESQDGISACRKTVFLHVGDFSWVPPLSDVEGVAKNSCWGWERRSDGFTCKYAAGQADRVATGDGSGPFASYDELDPTHTYEATAVANCASESGRPVKTYAGNAPYWNQKGIPASVKFAELYLHQDQADPYYSTWYHHYRGSFSPMINLSPETGVDAYDTYSKVMRICNAVDDEEWIGIYFWDATGPGMQPWQAQEILYALNACTRA